MAQWVLRAILVLPEQTPQCPDQKVHRDRRAILVLQVRKAFKANLEQTVLFRVRQAIKVCKVSRA
jgi:hypothetical protein